jgi:hypothetical protein
VIVTQAAPGVAAQVQSRVVVTEISPEPPAGGIDEPGPLAVTSHFGTSGAVTEIDVEPHAAASRVLRKDASTTIRDRSSIRPAS